MEPKFKIFYLSNAIYSLIHFGRKEKDEASYEPWPAYLEAYSNSGK